jgi:GT2 family glycosyltransferase/glycosyltransferase involved in cell wall biosynthesis
VPFERVLLRAKGEELFSADFYLDYNPDVRASGIDPLDHYMRYGWREGRSPNAFFDDGHYRAESGLVRGAPVSALGHFLAMGRESGLCPVPGVDLAAYRARHPALSVARIDPYQHLLGQNAPPATGPDIDAVLLWQEGLQASQALAEVDVIVPAYLGRAETLNTLCHVLSARNRTGFSLIVVNDASPDLDLTEDLRRMADAGQIELIEQSENKGFVASINAGCAIRRDRDVIWLNADTEVYDGWIDRLKAAAYSRPNVATVTPMTNNGTICSYPRFNTDNPGVLETPWARLDKLAGRFNRGGYVETPTAVGFCTYVRRAALDEMTGLDEEAFGRGYGEENDFSQRAINCGWVNLVATNVVVRHFGATSFRDSRADRIEAALKVLDRRYPGYRQSINAFLAADPLASARRSLDLARLVSLSGTRNVLIVTHSRGGGTQQHVQEEVARLSGKGFSVYILYCGPKGRDTVRLVHSKADALPALSSLDLKSDWLWRALAILRISEVHIHHLIDLGRDAPLVLIDRLAELGIPFEFIVHDYFPVCPRVNMVDLSGRYCGEPGDVGCQRCLDRRGSEAGAPDIRDWRDAYRQLLTAARIVRVPDQDVAERLLPYFPDLENIKVVPHEHPEDMVGRTLPDRRPGPLRIAVIGAIGPIKGFDALLGLRQYLKSKGEDAELTVIGYTRNDDTARGLGIRVTGPYLNSDVQDIIAREEPDLIWISSIWPETYCYTLSIAIRSGRPIAGFEIGAIATRLRACESGYLIPLSVADQPEILWRELVAAARSKEATGLKVA